MPAGPDAEKIKITHNALIVCTSKGSCDATQSMAALPQELPHALESPDQDHTALIGQDAKPSRRASKDGSFASASRTTVTIEVEVSLPVVAPLTPPPAAPTRIGSDKKLEYVGRQIALPPRHFCNILRMYLDGVRGIMCLIVLCDHWLMMGYYDRPTSPTDTAAGPLKDGPFFGFLLTRTPLRIFVAGEFAVATFFVLRCVIYRAA